MELHVWVCCRIHAQWVTNNERNNAKSILTDFRRCQMSGFGNWCQIVASQVGHQIGEWDIWQCQMSGTFPCFFALSDITQLWQARYTWHPCELQKATAHKLFPLLTYTPLSYEERASGHKPFQLLMYLSLTYGEQRWRFKQDCTSLLQRSDSCCFPSNFFLNELYCWLDPVFG